MESKQHTMDKGHLHCILLLFISKIQIQMPCAKALLWSPKKTITAAT